MKVAWIAGASGLVGSHVLPLLLADSEIETVVSLGRRRLVLEHGKLVQRLVDFGALDVVGLPSPDVALCTLGTTIGRAGNQEAFRAVDHDAVLAFAKAARAAGAKSFILVSSLGADAGSSVFYSRIKGQVEADLQALDYTSLAIARPSLLLGDRVESRPAERVAVVAARWLGPLLKPFAARPIEVAVVARALLSIVHESPAGSAMYPSQRLQILGGG